MAHSTISLWPTGRFMVLGLVTVAILLGGFGAWSVFAQISGAIIASGQIEVERNRQVIQHPDGGIVAEILVSEGDKAQAGDLLIRLDPKILTSELNITQGRLFEFMARRNRLEAERDNIKEVGFDAELLQPSNDMAHELVEGQRQLFAARLTSLQRAKEQLSQRRVLIESQIQGIDAQKSALETQRTLIEQELEGKEQLLQRGLSQSAPVLALKREQASLLGREGELTAAKAQAREQMTAIELEVLSIETTRREEAIKELRDVGYSELELVQRRQALQTQLDRLDIRAPVSGTVYGLSVYAPRSVLRPADPVMYLVPQDRPLIIAAKVPTTDIDQLHLGQTAVMRFSAFDQRTTPELQGKVTLISADAFADEATQQSFYRIELHLDEGELRKLPKSAVLIPGMPVEAYVRTSERNLLNYLTKPLTDYFNKAFREG